MPAASAEHPEAVYRRRTCPSPQSRTEGTRKAHESPLGSAAATALPVEAGAVRHVVLEDADVMRRGPCRQAASDQMCYGWMESAEALPRWPGHTGRCSMDGRSVGRTWMETASRPQRRNRGQSSQSPSKGRRARVPTPTSPSQSSPVPIPGRAHTRLPSFAHALPPRQAAPSPPERCRRDQSPGARRC